MSGWVSRGTVVLDGKHYHIKDLEDSDSFAPGTRFVSLSLVEVNPVTPEEIDDNYAKDLVEDLPSIVHHHNFDRLHGFCRCGGRPGEEDS